MSDAIGRRGSESSAAPLRENKNSSPPTGPLGMAQEGEPSAVADKARENLQNGVVAGGKRRSLIGIADSKGEEQVQRGGPDLVKPVAARRRSVESSHNPASHRRSRSQPPASPALPGLLPGDSAPPSRLNSSAPSGPLVVSGGAKQGGLSPSPTEVSGSRRGAPFDNKFERDGKLSDRKFEGSVVPVLGRRADGGGAHRRERSLFVMDPREEARSKSAATLTQDNIQSKLQDVIKTVHLPRAGLIILRAKLAKLTIDELFAPGVRKIAGIDISALHDAMRGVLDGFHNRDTYDFLKAELNFREEPSLRKALVIAKKFFAAKSDNQINLSTAQLSGVMNRIKAGGEPDATFFDGERREIARLMVEQRYFPKFIALVVSAVEAEMASG